MDEFNKLNEQVSVLSESIRRAGSLPIDQRMAWGTAVIERVLSGFSDYFLNKYHQHSVLECAWDFILRQRDDMEERYQLIKKVEAMQDHAELEGYGGEDITTSLHLLEELDARNSVALLSGVSYGAGVLIDRELFRHGYWDHSEITEMTLTTYEFQYHLFADNCLRIVEAHRGPLERNMFDHVKLEIDRIVLPKRNERSRYAPRHEYKGEL